MSPDRTPTTAVVLVEGPSDQQAVLTLAQRLGRDLAGDGIQVIELGGGTNFTRAVARYGPAGAGYTLAGLYDAAEEYAIVRALRQGGLIGGAGERSTPEALGFFVCDADLEDELIRSLGPDAVEAVIGGAGEAKAWQTFRRQPAQQDRPIAQQLRRFCGTKGGRKIRYGRLLVEALDLDRIPPPLSRLLAHV